MRVYDASYAPGGPGAPDGAVANGVTNIDTQFTLERPDGTVINSVTALSRDTFWEDQWRTVGTIDGSTPGTYVLRVETPTNEANSFGVNSFAIRTYTGGSYNFCTTELGEPGFSTSCPQIHGIDYVSVRTITSGGSADFYLADVEAANAGKRMRITLFDPGEGADSIELLDPNGNPVNFDWSTPCGALTAPAGGCSGSGSSLDVSGNGPQPGPGRASQSRYNDRELVLEVDLPQDYAAQFGDASWWRVRYSCLLYTSPSPRDATLSRMPSSA